MISTFLWEINIFWTLTPSGAGLRSYQASGPTARALPLMVLPQTRVLHSCLCYPID
jgi:hypothetical protein